MGSATVPIAAGVSLVTAAVVILCREVVVKVAIPCHGLTSATREGGEGGAVAELPIVEVLCHEIVRRSFGHVPSIRGQGRSLGVMVDSASGGTGHQRERCFGATLPDDAGLAPCFGDALGALQVAGVVCSPLVKFAPCFRLNGVHAQRCLIDLIIEAQRRPNAI